MYKDIHTFSLKPKVSLGRGVFYMGRGFNKFGPTRLGRGVIDRPGPRCRWAEMSVHHRLNTVQYDSLKRIYCLVDFQSQVLE